MLVIAAALMFAVVLVRALVAFARTRDRLHGAVALVFAPVGALFLLQVVRIATGTAAPDSLRLPSLVLLLGQPVFTLGLVSVIRSMPRGPILLAFVGWSMSSTIVATSPTPLPGWAALTIVGYFVVFQLIAAAYFASEARRRSGAAAARIAAAAAGTALFGLVLLISGMSRLAPHSWQLASVSRIVALAPAFAYVVAFLPPAWLRRQWSARTAYRLMSRLFAATSSAPPEQIWQHYAETMRDAFGAEGAVVLTHGPVPTTVAAAGLLPDADLGGLLPASRNAIAPLTMPPPGHLDEPGSGAAAAEPVTGDAVAVEPVAVEAGAAETAAVPAAAGVAAVPAADSAGRGSARWTKIGGRRYLLISVPLTMHGGGAGSLLMFGPQRTLFSEDDIVVLTDIGRQTTVLADRAVLTAQLTSTVDALRAANEAKSDFVAAMSHELRTPLNAIIGFSELMGLEELIGDRRQVPDEWIGNVHSSGRHLLGLINDVLDLAKVESGRIDLRVEPIDVGAAVAEAVAPLSALVSAKKLRLTLAAPPELVTADRMRLRQILNNLLSNAIKFTPVNGTIYVSAHREGAEVHLSVADTGPGIDPVDQERVFEEFHQSGDAESRAAGTGLGLALTRRLAEAHGGRVELWSEPGRGSRFTLVLPAAERISEPVTDSTEEAAVHDVRGGILVIEDDLAAASLLRTYLTGAGYPVHVVASGEAGLDYAARYAPDLILLDVLLPGMDGWSVLDRLKSDDRLCDIPVVVVTVVDEREVALALGAVDYFVKPVERGALLSMLERHAVAQEPAERTGVLAVDADPDSLAGLEAWLRACGLRVTPTLSAAEALALTRTVRFELIMFEAGLPGPDGGPMLDSLRAEPGATGIPVVVLTTGEITAADGHLAGLIGPGSPVLSVISRTDLSPEHLRRWLGEDILVTA